MKNSGDLVFIYTTLPDESAAVAMARALVERRLAACCNILPLMRSLYLWEGANEETQEPAMLLKTRRALIDEATAAATALHPFETPCLLTLPIESANAAYLAWALGETAR